MIHSVHMSGKFNGPFRMISSIRNHEIITVVFTSLLLTLSYYTKTLLMYHLVQAAAESWIIIRLPNLFWNVELVGITSIT